MMKLDIKRGHFSKIDGKVKDLMKENFGNVTVDGEWLVSEFGAMKPIKVSLIGKTKVNVDIKTETNVDEETIVETLKRKNRFLEALTGFTAKERAKKLQKKAKEGKL